MSSPVTKEESLWGLEHGLPMQVLNRLGAIEPVLTMLKDAGKDYIVYDQVKPNPTVQQVKAVWT